MNEFNLAGIIFVISFIFALLVSLLTEEPGKEKVAGLVWKPSMMKLPEDEIAAGYPWYKNLWMWSAVWVAVMVAIYTRFW